MKTCSKCKIEKPLDCFYRNGKFIYSICKDCKKCYWNNKRRENIDEFRAKSLAYIKKIKKRNQKLVFEYLSKHPCVDCGESRIEVLEFDHVRGNKKYNISAIYSYSFKTIMKEIKKCDVRCCNCHRLKTAKQINSLRFRNSANKNKP